MKYVVIFLAVFFSIFLVTYKVKAQITKTLMPVSCVPTKEMMNELKESGFKPIIIGEGENKIVTVFIDNDKSVVGLYSMKMNDKDMSCVVLFTKDGAEVLEVQPEKEERKN